MESKCGNNNLLRLLKQFVVVLCKTTTNHITKTHIKRVTPHSREGLGEGKESGRGRGEGKGEEEGKLVAYFLV